MFKKSILILSLIIVGYSQSDAQNMQVVYQLTQSCYVSTEGNIFINPGGHYTTAASEQVYLRDSLYGSIYDTVSSSFKNNKRIAYAYDSGGLLTESTGKTVDKSGLSWSNSQQISFKYTGFQLFEETYKNWDKTLNDWVNFLNYKYSYESDNSLLSIFYQSWDATNSNWEYSTKDLISYDLNNKTNSVASQKWNKNLNIWENYLRINLTYSEGYVSEKTYQVWDKSASAWEDYQKESFTYTDHNKSEVVMQVKSLTTGWENYSRTVFTYQNSILNNATEYVWNGAWAENKKYNYSYNTNNLVINVVTQQWATHLSLYRNLSQDEMYYSQHEVIGIDETPLPALVVSNPLSKNSAFTLAGLKENTKYRMKIISLNGSTVMDMPVTAGQEVKLSGQLQNGIYLLTITAPGMKSLSQKLLITD